MSWQRLCDTITLYGITYLWFGHYRMCQLDDSTYIARALKLLLLPAAAVAAFFLPSCFVLCWFVCLVLAFAFSFWRFCFVVLFAVCLLAASFLGLVWFGLVSMACVLFAMFQPPHTHILTYLCKVHTVHTYTHTHT